MGIGCVIHSVAVVKEEHGGLQFKLAVTTDLDVTLGLTWFKSKVEKLTTPTSQESQHNWVTP